MNPANLLKTFKNDVCGHPLITAAAAVLCVLSFLRKGLGSGTLPDAFLTCGLILILLIVSLRDVETMCIPDACHMAILLLGTARLLLGFSRLPSSIAGFFCVSAPLLLISVFFGGFGGGDIKLCAAAGFFLGLPGTVLGALMGAVLGAGFSVLLILMKKANRKSSIPFGPFLSLGFGLSALYGADWLSMYFSLFLP